MKLRFAAPSLLVDISGLEELRGIGAENGELADRRRHPPRRPRRREGRAVVAHAASLIADQQVRNRGTIGGSLAHGDPASDLPAVLLAAEGAVIARGPGRRADDRRRRPVRGLPDDRDRARRGDHRGARCRRSSGYGWGYEKFTRRSEDWAMVGVCALVKAQRRPVRGRAHRAHPHGRRRRCAQRAAEEALRGGPLDADADRAPRPSRPPRAPIRPATSTPPPTTSATWPGS